MSETTTTSGSDTEYRPANIRDKGAGRLVLALASAEIRVFLRQPVMVALTLLLPVGLIMMTAFAEVSDRPESWAQVAGRDLVAIQCISVYFVALNTLTARRHTLALKRLRTTALSSLGIVGGLLVPPILVGAFQVIVVLVGLMVLGAPAPKNAALVAVSVLLGIALAALAGVATSGFTSTPEKAQWTMLPLFIAATGATAALPAVDPGPAAVMLAVPLVSNGHLATTGWYSGRIDTESVVLDLVYMTMWIVVFSIVSWKTFRWERRR